MRTVQGAALDGLRARVRALAARRRPERAGRSPRGGAPLADRGPALQGPVAQAPGRRTSGGQSSRYAAPAPETAARAALAGFGVLLRGLTRPRPGEVHTSAAVLRALRARRGDAPALVRTRSGRTVLVLLDPQDLRRFYAEPVGVLAAATPDKCRGPNPGNPVESADTADSGDSACSRGEFAAERREAGAEVLASGRPVHPSHAPFLAALAEEARHLTGSGPGTAAVPLDLARARYAVHRAARRIVLGDAAAADEQLSGWLTHLRAEERGSRGGRVRAARSVHDRARARIAEYAALADEATLVGRAARHAGPAGTLDPVGQAQHWLLAMDAVPDTLLRTLLLLGAHPAEQDLAVAEAAAEVAAGAHRGELPRLRACVRESLRLYPVVPDLIRVTRAETEWRGVRYPAGTSVLVPAAFHQRDPERVPAAHVFVPGRWKNPGADQDIRMAPFGHGGGRCPGDQLGLMATAALCAEVLRGHRVTGTRPVLDPVGPLPAMLDPRGIRLTLTRR